MFCKSCGVEIPKDSKFCPECGSKVEKEVKKVYCTHCGEKIDYNVSVCPYCGKCVKSEYSNEIDEESILFDILAFFIPFMGLILWAVMKDKTPMKANGIIKYAAVGFIFWTILRIVF